MVELTALVNNSLNVYTQYVCVVHVYKQAIYAIISCFNVDDLLFHNVWWSFDDDLYLHFDT